MTLTYETAEGGWAVNAYIRNIENAAVINSVAGGYPVMPNLLGVNAYLDEPRTFGFNVRKTF